MRRQIGGDALERGAIDQAAHVDFGAGHLAGGVEMEGRGKAAEGAAFDGFFAGVGPLQSGAHAAGLRFVTGPIKFRRPSGGFAVLVVEVEKGAVFAALGVCGEFCGEEGLQHGGGGGVHRHVDRDGFAALRHPDAVATGRHVLDVGGECSALV